MKNSISAIILAAGQSERMNQPKPFLLFDEKRNFLDKINGTYISADIQQIILVVNPAIESDVKRFMENKYPDQPVNIVVNLYPEKGRFYSIRLGLEKTDSSFCYIQNIDNPFVTTELLIEMGKRVKQGTYVAPVYKKKKGHPVLISGELIDHCRMLKGDDYNLRKELNKFEEIKLDWTDKNILANINTDEEYQKYFPSCEVFMK
ncbi:MAG: hypothetical protein FJY20_11150 [Bacteroidetes bacterium]|nr:hypothetical protein [Bacteroidota bacterium]